MRHEASAQRSESTAPTNMQREHRRGRPMRAWPATRHPCGRRPAQTLPHSRSAAPSNKTRPRGGGPAEAPSVATGDSRVSTARVKGRGRSAQGPCEATRAAVPFASKGPEGPASQSVCFTSRAVRPCRCHRAPVPFANGCHAFHCWSLRCSRCWMLSTASSAVERPARNWMVTMRAACHRLATASTLPDWKARSTPRNQA